jgi:hypothetical protein
MDESRLSEIIARIIEGQGNQERINPAWIATEAMLLIDPAKIVQQQVPLAYLAAHLHLRQIARAECRHLFEDNTHDKRQHELFPGLQWRYPAAHQKDNGEPVYVLLNQLTPEDVSYNVVRLNGEAVEKQRHARRLIAWAKKKFGRQFKAPRLKRA